MNNPATTAAPAPQVLALVKDMIFAVKIVSTARSLGVRCQTVLSATGLAGACAAHQPALVIVDLDLPGLDVQAVASAVQAFGAHTRVVGYLSHTQVEMAAAAKAAGIAEVMPRSAFTRNLPELLQAAGQADIKVARPPQ
ncbi:MAG: hypothetical protein HKL96_09995 [Phycisphaerales bacterium]|nr:hypothetical protein [Phycisphaerales bacterium]